MSHKANTTYLETQHERFWDAINDKDYETAYYIVDELEGGWFSKEARTLLENAPKEFIEFIQPERDPYMEVARSNVEAL